MQAQEIQDRVLQIITVLSARFGSGDGLGDAILVCLVLSLFCLAAATLVALTRRGKPAAKAPQGEERVPVLGRLEKFERSLNENRTEVLREVAGLRSEVRYLKDEVKEIRHHLETKEPLRTIEREGLALRAEEAEVEVPAPSELSDKLGKTRAGLLGRIRSLFSAKGKLDDSMVEELRAQLIAADLGVKTAEQVVDEARKEWTEGDPVKHTEFEQLLKKKLLEIVTSGAPLEPSIKPVRHEDGPLVVLVVGVNGVGKTTTVAKLSAQWKQSGAKVMMVAADTFRAAAVEQLVEWGKRLDVPVITGAPEAKPSTVVFDAMEKGKAAGVDVIIIDTAGRLHTKANLMQELEGIRNAISRHQASAPHEVLLVVDGSTGQNAIQQAREFNEAAKLTGVAVTKLDGTPKGGVVVAIKSELGIPVRYIGVGETPDDLRVFVPEAFVQALFS